MKSDQITKELGEVRRDIIHHMGRRCRDWDYGGRAIYMITINLKERGRPVMAEWPRFLDVSGSICHSRPWARRCYHAGGASPNSGRWLNCLNAR